MLIPAMLSSTLALAATAPSHPSMDKRTIEVQVSREIPYSADQVWTVVAADYGRIATAHPKIVRSEYVEGSLTGELGAQRLCYFNDKSTQMLHEQIVSWDPANMVFENRILETDGFPLDPDNTLAVYSVEAIDASHSRVVIGMDYRLKPAMMGPMMKGAFTNLLEDYLISVEHHLRTGEAVNRDNFKTIAKNYR